MFFEELKLYSPPKLLSNTDGTTGTDDIVSTWLKYARNPEAVEYELQQADIACDEAKNTVITILLPGVEIKNLVISAIRPKLKISIHDFKIPPGASAKMYDKYEFSLADTADLDNITASLNAGILTITVPRIVIQKENIKIIPIT